MVEGGLPQQWGVGFLSERGWVAAMEGGGLLQWWGMDCCTGGEVSCCSGGGMDCCTGGGWVAAVVEVGCCTGGEVDLSTTKTVEGMWRQKTGGLMSR